MFKRISFFLSLAAIAVLAVAAFADTPAPGGPFSTAFRVQNLSASDAVCAVEFFDAAGTTIHTLTPASPIAAGDSLYVFTPSESGLPAGQYSGVVSCDQSVASVVNFSDADSGASHNGVAGAELATTWYAPSVYNNYYNFYSNLVVQNATNGPIDITVEIMDDTAAVVSTMTASSVPASASVSFDQSTDSNLMMNKAYSAKITGTGNVAAIVNIYGLAGANNQLYSYNPFSGGSMTAYAPVIMNAYFGYNTALTIQNIDVTTANVTVNYGSGGSETAVISPGAAAVFLNFGTGAAIPAGTLTGATITSDANVVATVNESNNYNRAATYSAFASGNTSVSTPIVMRRYFNYNSSVTCQNVGSTAADITIDYGSGTTVVNTASGSSALFYQPADANLSDGFIGSATISSTEPIVCVVNQDINEGTGATTSQDQLFAYNGIGQ